MSWEILLTDSKLKDNLGTCQTDDKHRDDVGITVPDPTTRDLDPSAKVMIDVDEVGCKEVISVGLPVM